MLSAKEFFKNIPKFFRNVLIVELVILILAILFWWFVGPHTKERFVNILFVCGAIAIIIGYLIRSGSREGTYGLTYQYFRTFGNTTRDERIKHDGEDLDRSFSDLIVLFTSGIIAFVLSVLIYIIFKKKKGTLVLIELFD